MLEKVYDLPEELSETSGIILYDSLIWTFNDSGDEAKIYGLHLTSGTILKTIEITSGKNKDWEDIAQNQEFIYIGDFGNNEGSRKDLKIYMIPKKSITNQKLQQVDAFVIDFFYEDQEDFTPATFANQYDCEAMIATRDSLYLFTKDWLNLQTSIYSLPASEGEFVAQHVRDFECEGLVTGADYNFDSKRLVLCGYSLFYPFIIIINNINDLKVVRRIEFEEISGLQIEGITFMNDTRFYISNEKSSDIQAVHRITWNND
ncbi:MAG TPA: hypothetical protein VJ346_04720 [Bacteroidales bacterium]|nr:hypothetical protein [Bacteroidales bacterium]